jgi:hypothetical protein
MEKTEKILDFEKKYLELLVEKEDDCYFDNNSDFVVYTIKQNENEYLRFSLRNFFYFSISIDKYIGGSYVKQLTQITLYKGDPYNEYFKNIYNKKIKESEDKIKKEQIQHLKTLKDEYNKINKLDIRRIKLKKC